jgi:hypothetical protein
MNQPLDVEASQQVHECATDPAKADHGYRLPDQ